MKNIRLLTIMLSLPLACVSVNAEAIWIELRADKLGPFVPTSDGVILTIDAIARFGTSDAGKSCSPPRTLFGAIEHNIQVSNRCAMLRTQDRTIITFGDSTTAPRGQLRTYSQIVQQRLNNDAAHVRLINAGIGGNHTNHARARFERDVLTKNPDTVVIQFGINDAAVDVWKTPPATHSRVSLAQYADNLRYFVQRLKSAAVNVILMTPNPIRWTPRMLQMYGKPPYDPTDEDGFSLVLRDYTETTRRIAAETQTTLVDVDKAFRAYGKQSGQSIDDLLRDGIHPNNRGHELIADYLQVEIGEQSTDI